jgi:NTE family protein
MRASMAIPGAFKPVRMGDQMLFDGGCINNLPVDVVKDMGADIVIAIDLNQTQHENRDISLEEMFGITGILDWLVSRPDWKRYNANREAADLLINPPLEGYDVLSFSKTKVAEMLKIGESTGRKFRSQLITIKNNL